MLFVNSPLLSFRKKQQLHLSVNISAESINKHHQFICFRKRFHEIYWKLRYADRNWNLSWSMSCPFSLYVRRTNFCVYKFSWISRILVNFAEIEYTQNFLLNGIRESEHKPNLHKIHAFRKQIHEKIYT